MPCIIKTVCVTGGPCAGKTTILDEMREKGRIDGFRILIVPESSTLLMENGPSWKDGEGIWQELIFNTQRRLEDSMRCYAEELGNEKVLIVCDRGILDGYAYMEEDEFRALLAGYGESDETISKRYDAIVHLSSAAKGAEGAYTCENNPFRRESAEEARILDDRTWSAWEGRHPAHILVGDGDDGFAGKKKRFYEVLSSIVAE